MDELMKLFDVQSFLQSLFSKEPVPPKARRKSEARRNPMDVGARPNIPTAVKAPKLWYVLRRLLIRRGRPYASAFIDPVSQRMLLQYLPQGLPDTTGWSASQRFDLYSLYVMAYGTTGARINLSFGQSTILGLRMVTSTKANKGLGAFDDRFVVLWYDWARNQGEAYEFAGNTEPAWYYDAMNPNAKKIEGQDADGDNKADLGRIPVGTFEFRKDNHPKRGNILRPLEPIRLERDTNHDGWFGNDQVDPKHSNNLYASDTFFHRGGRGGFTGSAGCQTLEGEVFDNFWKALGSQKKFYYVLLSVGIRD
ncbi:MAG: hypothetical protein WCB68_20875 [Pyrinomonadaceae bacterium]